MPSIDMPLSELTEYRPPLTRSHDFDAYWSETLSESRALAYDARVALKPYPGEGVELLDVELAAFGGGTIFCKLMRPKGARSLPAIVFYHGYSGEAPLPFGLLPWACQGFVAMGVDCRGQGGRSTDGAVYPGGHRPGFMTQGIEDPKRYYYRYAYADCVRALDWLSEQDEVDEHRMGITGISQGGGLTLAVAGLSDRPKLAVPEVPYLCHFRRSVDVATAGPYAEISDWLRNRPEMSEQTWQTLSYVDGMNLADRIRCRTVVTVGLWDDICPPSSVYAAYNHMQVDKRIEVFEFARHESPMHFAETRFEIIKTGL
ncbi:MAG: acetylxylan esterase [Phycisphaerae bacterium]|nr:acetylxylan esterase [Phycisphaerae bacterium]